MSGKTICFFSLFAAIAILVSGCSGVYVPKPEVDETLAQQQEYIKALEHRNRELEAENAALNELLGDAEFFSAQREFYDQIARNVEKWLTAQGGDLSGVKYNPRTGSWTMEGDLLFASRRSPAPTPTSPSACASSATPTATRSRRGPRRTASSPRRTSSSAPSGPSPSTSS
jgi:hypothetical protein